MIVETLLIAAMTAFHFAIMPGSFGPNLFVEDRPAKSSPLRFAAEGFLRRLAVLACCAKKAGETQGKLEHAAMKRKDGMRV